MMLNKVLKRQPKECSRLSNHENRPNVTNSNQETKKTTRIQILIYVK